MKHKILLLCTSTLAVFGTAKICQKKRIFDYNSIGLVRFSRAAYTALGIGFTYKWHLYQIDKESDLYIDRLRHCHKLGAQKFLNLCQLNKGVYIKIGQHIGALDYLFPEEYVEALRILHKNAPKNSLDEVKQVICQEFPDKNPDDIFTEMDAEPLGTASLAQVHKASLKDGTKVAVKVQHAFVRDHAKSDLKIMEFLVSTAKKFFKDLELDWLVDITKSNLPKELDFIHEAQNAKKLCELFQDLKWLKVPKIFWDLTTERVLTMEYIEGGYVNDAKFIRENKVDANDITQKLGTLYSRMVFKHGFVHGDPHPGNILIQLDEKNPAKFKIVLIDHGLYANLNEDFRFNYANLWLAILQREHNTIKKFSLRLGIKDDQYFGLLACVVSGRTWNSIMEGIYTKQFSEHEREIFQKNLPVVLPRLMNMLNRVNRQIILILKVNDLLRGIEYALKTEKKMKSFITLTLECQKSIFDYKKRNLGSRKWLQKCKLNLQYFWFLAKLRLFSFLFVIKNQLSLS